MNIVFVVSLRVVGLNLIHETGKEIPRVWGTGSRNRAWNSPPDVSLSSGSWVSLPCQPLPTPESTFLGDAHEERQGAGVVSLGNASSGTRLLPHLSPELTVFLTHFL